MNTHRFILKSSLTLMIASGTALAEDYRIDNGQTVNVTNETRTVNGDLHVGYTGEGTLIIGAGGVFENIDGRIGRASEDSFGAVRVEGEGARWTNSGTLDIGGFGGGTLTLSNSGQATAPRVRMGLFSPGYGNLIIGADADDTALAPGVLDADYIETGEGEGRIVFNHTDTSGDYIFVPQIRGKTRLEHYAGTTRLTGDNSYTGGTIFDGGTLVLGHDNALGTGALAVTGATQGGRPTLQSGQTFSKISNDIVFDRPFGLPFASFLTIRGDNDLELAGQLSGSGALSKDGSGTLTLSGDNSAFSGWLELNSGTLRVAHSQALSLKSFYFYGGTLDYADGIELNTDIVAVSWRSGSSLHVDNGAFATQSGTIYSSPSDALSKTGSGTLKLSDDNSFYRAAMIIDDGMLLVDGSLAQSELVHVNPGATLGGSGTVSNTTVKDGGRLAPGGDAMGTLTIDGDLTLGSGSVLDYQLGTPGTSGNPASGRSDRLDISGDLELNGRLNLAQSGDSDGGLAGLGYYRLMTYGGELSGSGLTLGKTPSLDAGYGIEAGNNRVDLFIAAAGDDALQHWQGGDGVWNASGTTWRNAGEGAPDGDIPVAWAGNHAIFKNQPGDFDGGVVAVEGAQAFKGLQFVDDGYRLEGSGVLETHADSSEIRVLAERAEIATDITGTGGITKTQAGMLVLSGANTYSGGTTLAGGTLSVSADANLGHEDGALTFDGGTLQVNGTDFKQTERDIVWGTHGGGLDIAHEAHHFHVNQNISGQGDLIKRGDGALTLAGSNDYGNTLVEDGWLLGTADSISGNIANAGVVEFNQVQDGSFAGDITGLGGIDGAVIKDGTGTLTLEGHSQLDWTVASGTLVTNASRFTGDAHLDSSTSGLTFNDANNGIYGGALSGTGQFTMTGSGFVLLSGDSSGFAGHTMVRAGTLQVGDADGEGSLGGSVDVLNGATLAGSGTVGSGSGSGSHVTIASGGTLAPGNSIGTLTVDGDLVFERGSRFEVEVNPQGSDSDRIEVTGDATLHGGTVAHIGTHGDYDPRSSYTILTAGGALTGAFDEVTSDFAFLTPDLLYDYGAGTVELELSRNEREFASAALTRNQIATAGGIESIGLAAGHAVYDAIVQLPNDENLIRRSFDALSGEIHASLKTAFIEDSRFIRHAATDRVRAALAAPGASGAPVSSYGADRTPLAVAADHHGPVVWSQAFGSWGKTDSNGNAASLDRTTGGMLIGADRPVGDWRIGVLAGYSHTDIKARDRASTGKSDNYHLGLYGGTQWDALGLRTGVAYTWHDIDTRRSVTLPGLSGNPKASYDAGTFQAFAELGYGMEAGAFRLEPFVNVAHVRLHTDRYGESGGATGLSGNSKNTDVTFTTLGLHAEHALDIGATAATLRGTLGWRHAFGDTTPKARHGFSAGDAFTVAGAPIAKDSAVIKAGIDLNLTPDATFGLSYAGQLAGSARDHGVNANLTIRY